MDIVEQLRSSEFPDPHESDPALSFCHRFAVLMECMILGDYRDKYWDEATTLLSEYYEAEHKWRESMGEPYVSGFGKD